MRLSLRDYTTDELEALRAEVLQAIELAENPPVVVETPPPEPVCAAAVAAAEPAPPATAPPATAPPAPDPEPAAPVTAAPAPAAPPAAVIRYMHPANRQLTWSGEGEVPEWITAYLARGGSWMAMENTAAKLAPQRKILR
jgi:hypothetical protein